MDIKVYQPLGKYIEQIRGVSYKPNDIYDKKCDESIAILRANNIQNNHVDLSDLIYINKNKVSEIQKLKKGDILICASSGSKNLVGKATIINNDLNMSFGAFCKVLRTSKLNQRFLGHYFASPIYRKTISRLSVGANINNIRKEHIDNLMIPIYSSEKQTKISDILDKISILIDYSSEKLKKYDELVKSQFIEMFGDSKTTESIRLKDIAQIVTGSTPSMAVKDYYKSKDIRFYKPSDLINDINNLKDSDYWISEEARTVARIVPSNSILVSCIGTVGKIGITNTESTCNQQINAILPNEKFNHIYLAYNIATIKDKLQHIAKAPVVPIINKTTFGNIEIKFETNIELQNQFAEIVKHIDKLKFRETITKLKNLCYNIFNIIQSKNLSEVKKWQTLNI